MDYGGGELFEQWQRSQEAKGRRVLSESERLEVIARDKEQCQQNDS